MYLKQAANSPNKILNSTFYQTDNRGRSRLEKKLEKTQIA